VKERGLGWEILGVVGEGKVGGRVMEGGGRGRKGIGEGRNV